MLLSDKHSFQEFVRIEVYDFQERYVGNLEGAVLSGSFQYAGNSPVRRTLSIAAHLGGAENTYNMLTINRKFKAFVIHTDGSTTKEWPLGCYVATSINKSPDGTVSLTAMDKMALLNGTVSGTIEGILYADKVVSVDSEGNETETKMRLDEIIYYAAAGLGGERRENILISNIPEKIKSAMVYEGSTPIYMDDSGNISLTPVEGWTTIEFGDYIGYTMQDFVFPSDLIKQAGTPISGILDDIVNLLGNFEYFYDVDGRLVFQEIRNYLNNQFKNYTQLDNGDYLADLQATPFTYRFGDDDPNLISISSNPQWGGVKNNFVVWGTAQGVGRPVAYHLVVDSKPKLPDDITIPYQQYLINVGDRNPTDPGPYYGELKSKFPQIYDAEKNEWKGGPNDWSYYFDMVDSDADYSKFSVSEIGKRTVAVTDSQVGSLFNPIIPDFVLINLGDSDATEQMDYLTSIGQKFVSVEPNLFKQFRRAAYSKSAFEVVRDLLYNYTTAVESVSMTTKPMLELEPNTLVQIQSPSLGVNGEFLIQSISYQFGSPMNIAAIEVAKRT